MSLLCHLLLSSMLLLGHVTSAHPDRHRYTFYEYPYDLPDQPGPEYVRRLPDFDDDPPSPELVLVETRPYYERPAAGTIHLRIFLTPKQRQPVAPSPGQSPSSTEPIGQCRENFTCLPADKCAALWNRQRHREATACKHDDDELWLCCPDASSESSTSSPELNVKFREPLSPQYINSQCARRHKRNAEQLISYNAELGTERTNQYGFNSTIEIRLNSTTEAGIDSSKEPGLGLTTETVPQSTTDAGLQFTAEAGLQSKSTSAGVQLTTEAGLQPTSAGPQFTTEAGLRSTTDVRSELTTVSTQSLSTTSADAIKVTTPIEKETTQTGTPYVIGGSFVTSPERWPFVVGIFVKLVSGYEFLCGGSLISGSAILTAAHCFIGRDPTEVYLIRAGEVALNPNTPSKTRLEWETNEVAVHPGFRYPVLYDDVAVMKIDDGLKEFTDTTRPVCLPESPPGDADGPPPPPQNPLAEQVNATVIGWGSREYGGDLSLGLQEAQFPLVPNSDCNDIYLSLRGTRASFPQGMESDILCAGNVGEPKDACKGDSGGPLVTIDDNDIVRLIGVVSSGYSCGTPGIPGIYTRVDRYLDWIYNYL